MLSFFAFLDFVYRWDVAIWARLDLAKKSVFGAGADRVISSVGTTAAAHYVSVMSLDDVIREIR